MKLISILFLLLTFCSCKTKKEINKNSSTITYSDTIPRNSDITKPLSMGKVTYFKDSQTCVNLIIQNSEKNTDSPTVLIPIDPLPENLNQEGTLIKFNYRILRIKNPVGCSKGMPSKLSNIEKVK